MITEHEILAHREGMTKFDVGIVSKHDENSFYAAHLLANLK
jgi:hypothetical protein